MERVPLKYSSLNTKNKDRRIVEPPPKRAEEQFIYLLSKLYHIAQCWATVSRQNQRLPSRISRKNVNGVNITIEIKTLAEM